VRETRESGRERVSERDKRERKRVTSERVRQDREWGGGERETRNGGKHPQE